jgi:hypothetical protein
MPNGERGSEGLATSFHCLTLGCKVNQYETEYVREGFLRLGYREAAAGE